jgi:hypothetical protein
MYSCLIISESSLTRRRYDAFSLAMMTSERAGDVVIQQPDVFTHQEIWCSMRHRHDGHPKI